MEISYARRLLFLAALTLPFLAILEAVLWAVPDPTYGYGRAIMPEYPPGILELNRGPEVEGVTAAWYDSGHLHVTDPYGFRRKNGPWPVKTGRRIVAVGDSLTYGEGVAKRDAWPAVLDRSLDGVEVLNLGRRGAQAEDVAELVRRMYEPRPAVTHTIPRLWIERHDGEPQLANNRFETPEERGLDLDPDLILYGVFWNDCNPSWTQYGLFDHRWWDNYRIGQMLFPPTAERGARRALDDYGDSCREAFAQLANTPVPVIVMVLHLPTWPGREIVAEIESLARDAGLEVISSTYLEDFEGDDWQVSQWQWHPRERAHMVYAKWFAERIGL